MDGARHLKEARGLLDTETDSLSLGVKTLRTSQFFCNTRRASLASVAKKRKGKGPERPEIKKGIKKKATQRPGLSNAPRLSKSELEEEKKKKYI
jgi:hypothetical protein